MKKILVNLSDDDLEQLVALSRLTNKSKSDFIRGALRKYFFMKNKEIIKQNATKENAKILYSKKNYNAQNPSLNK